MSKATPARPIAELDVHDLLKVIDMYADRRMWQSMTGNGNPQTVEMATRALATLPEVTALDALTAATVLAKLVTGRRWIDIMYAREQGASWAEVGQAMKLTADEARDWYAAKISHQARYTGDLHDAARAEAAL